MRQTDDLDKFLTRKKDSPRIQMEDESSLETEQFGGTVEGTVKFIRTGIESDKPIQGERAGAIYYATNTKKLWIWTGTEWLSEVFS